MRKSGNEIKRAVRVPIRQPVRHDAFPLLRAGRFVNFERLAGKRIAAGAG